MRILSFLAVFLLLISPLFGENEVLSPVTDQDDADMIALRLIEVLDIDIPQQRQLSLQIDAGPYTDALYTKLTEYFLQSDVQVLNRAMPECLVLRVMFTGIEFPGGRDVDVAGFTLELSENDTSRILDIQSIKLDVAKSENSDDSTMHWYDPVIITSIVGGLLYIFYYGNQ